jgi:hypothetical protein
MKANSDRLRELPLPRRFACIGGISGGTAGGIVGLVLGLVTYAPTAWFAVFELGLPAAVAGGAVGLFTGVTAVLAMNAARRLREYHGHARR